jgi:hypothetical protein
MECLINENYLQKYRNDCYNLGEFLKNEFPTVKFYWNEDSKGWWTKNKNFIDKYSMEVNFEYEKYVNILRNKYSKFRAGKLIVNSDYERLQITID